MSLWLKGQDWTVASLDELLMCHGKVDWVGVVPPPSPWRGSRSDFGDCCGIVIDGVVAGTTTSILPAYCAQRLLWSGGGQAALWRADRDAEDGDQTTTGCYLGCI